MTNWYVATTGNSGNPGTLASPWDITTGLTSSLIQPGDTVWLRGGTYNRTDATFQPSRPGVVGSGVDNPDGKVIYRNYNPTVSLVTDTGDPSQQERVIIQETNTTAAATSGATTVNGINGNGSATLSIAKGAGVNQAVSAGHQLTIATGPAAGRYVITAANTIVQNTNTTVAVAPNLRGATAGGEAISLQLGNSAIDLWQTNTGNNFIWLWGLELAGVLAQRTFETSGPTGWSTFNQTTDGLKLIHCEIHDLSGGCFLERTSGRMEVYGNLFYNQGYADTAGDGGGHHIYIHHNNNSAKRLTVEANCMFNDEGISMQMYDSAGASGAEQNVDFINNIAFNDGALNNATNLGLSDSDMFIVGGPQEISSINCNGNYGFRAAGHGDVFITIGQPGQLIGVTINVNNNYCYGGGSGFGMIRVPATIDVAGGGSLKFQNNTLRIPAPDATHNGRAYNLAQNGGAGYTWSGNTIYRNIGVGGNACGDETPGGIPFLAADVTGQCRTLAQFMTDCGFSGDTRAVDPSTTLVVTIPTTRYEQARGWVIYYNYANLANIPFSPSDFGIHVGDTFVVHDVRNIRAGNAGQGGSPVLGPTVYAGGTVNLPNTQVADPVMTGSLWGVFHETAPPSTAPTFNAFLVRRTLIGSSGSPQVSGNAGKQYKCTYTFASGTISIFAPTKEEADAQLLYRVAMARTTKGAWDVQPNATTIHPSFGVLQSVSYSLS